MGGSLTPFGPTGGILLKVRAKGLIFFDPRAVRRLVMVSAAVSGVKLYGSKLLRPNDLTLTATGVKIEDLGGSQDAASGFSSIWPPERVILSGAKNLAVRQ